MGVAVVMEQASIFFTLVSGWVTAARWTGYEPEVLQKDMIDTIATEPYLHSIQLAFVSYSNSLA